MQGQRGKAWQNRPRNMRIAPSLFLGLFLATSVVACSGNAVVEPGAQSSKRAKAYVAKCQAAPPADGTEVKMVYACLPAEDACPDPKDKGTLAELGYVLDKGSSCGAQTQVYDVPCGPDLNAIECCYAVRTVTSTQTCE